MINIEQQKKILQKILNSECFVDKDLYKNLLTYLVKASFGSEPPREIDIALEVFKKDKDFNAAEDTIVRVHMHKLRKRLEQYYQTEGKEDKIKLFIPKGHYKVKFTEKEKNRNSDRTGFTRRELIFIVGFLLVALVLLLDIFVFRNSCHFTNSISENKLWGNFFDNKYPTSIVIGDFLVFHEYEDRLGRSRRIQDYQINTIEDLDTYIAENPDKEVESWLLGELPHNSLYNIMDLHRVFLSYDQQVKIDFTTEIDINYIKNRNIIYIGEFKNLRALSNLTSILPIRQETLPWWHGTISYYQNDSLVTLKTSHDWNVSRYVVDLALVAKLPGENNENYLIFAGIGYNAQIKIVELFSNNRSITDLESEITKINGHVPEYYTMVFEVKGFDRASTKAELKYFHEVKNN